MERFGLKEAIFVCSLALLPSGHASAEKPSQPKPKPAAVESVKTKPPVKPVVEEPLPKALVAECEAWAERVAKIAYDDSMSATAERGQISGRATPLVIDTMSAEATRKAVLDLENRRCLLLGGSRVLRECADYADRVAALVEQITFARTDGRVQLTGQVISTRAASLIAEWSKSKAREREYENCLSAGGVDKMKKK